MLGSQVMLAAPENVRALGTDLAEGPGVDLPGADLADEDAVATLFEQATPLAGIIHCAAYTAVDQAEEEEELALRVNGLACGVLARACALVEIPLVIVGTDFVFDGTSTEPYREDDPTAPLSAYGRTKLAGEQAARAAWPGGPRVVRTQWLYGPRGRHFPGTMLALARERDELKVVADQVGSPTSTLELAPALWDVLLLGEAGIYHAACEGSCSWFDLATATLEDGGAEGVKVLPCATEEFPRPAPRPAHSVLNCDKLTALRGRPLAPWREALRTFLGSETP